jgi:hypothetical protein
VSPRLECRKSALRAKLTPLASTAAHEPYAGRRGMMRGAWPKLSIDQQRAIIVAAFGPATVSPAKPGPLASTRIACRFTRAR